MEKDRRSEIVGDEGEWCRERERERLHPTGHAGALS